MPREHAVLSPSAASRWMNCTASYNFTKNMPEVVSKCAEEGTFAHELLEHMVLDKPLPDGYMLNEYYNSEMLPYLQLCKDYIIKIQDKGSLLLVEKKVDILPDIFGYVDYIIVKGSTLHVLDLKYGTGRVKVQDNTQLKLYTYGAFRLLNSLVYIDNVKLHIMQPRINKKGYFASDRAVRSLAADRTLSA